MNGIKNIQDIEDLKMDLKSLKSTPRADEWVHQRVTESESDDDSVEALTVRTPLQ